jgi:hypothetical protein
LGILRGIGYFIFGAMAVFGFIAIFAGAANYSIYTSVVGVVLLSVIKMSWMNPILIPVDANTRKAVLNLWSENSSIFCISS